MRDSSEKSGTRRTRAELMECLSAAARDSSTATVLFHQAIARRLGLSASDHKCAELIARLGVVSAGDLAERMGMTTGAITGLLDRLERHGFVRREHDMQDRRRVLVYPIANPERERQISELFVPLSDAWQALCDDYSPEELELVLAFLQRSNEVMERETRSLQSRAPSG